jgi:hypothetical protein
MHNLLKHIRLFNRKPEFSIFSDLGDLSSYSLEELKLLAINFNISSNHLDNQLLTVWDNENTQYEILYTLSGSFIKIKSETWLYPNLNFKK